MTFGEWIDGHTVTGGQFIGMGLWGWVMGFFSGRIGK
jgi:hypothetical protein